MCSVKERALCRNLPKVCGRAPGRHMVGIFYFFRVLFCMTFFITIHTYTVYIVLYKNPQKLPRVRAWASDCGNGLVEASSRPSPLTCACRPTPDRSPTSRSPRANRTTAVKVLSAALRVGRRGGLRPHAARADPRAPQVEGPRHVIPPCGYLPKVSRLV